MLNNYFTVALRHLLKNKVFTAINALGLAVGIAGSLLVYCWIADELSYDRFHPQAEQLFRISNKAKESFYLFVPAQLSDYLQEEIPAVQLSADARWEGQTIRIRQGDEVTEEEGLLYVESEFLRMFNFPLQQGVDSLVLSRPHTVVLTPEMANKYFPGISPIGQRLVLTDGTEYEVTGVVAPPPSNSTIQFNFLAPATDLEETHAADAGVWSSGTGFTYVLTEENYTSEQLTADIQELLARYDAPADIWNFTVEPLRDVHLYSDFGKSGGVQGDIRYVYSFLVVGLLILGIACFNFINLATSRSLERAREVGVRKAAGASRFQLVSQFMSESLLITVFATGAGYLLATLALPMLNALADKNLSLNLHGQLHIAMAMLILVVLVTVLAGLYPAVMVATFSPIDALGKRTGGRAGESARLRQLLVILQFAASAVLVIGTVVIWQQLAFIRAYNLGFEPTQVVKIRNHPVAYDDFQTIKHELTQVPGVVGVTSAPMQYYSGSWFFQSDSLDQSLDMNGFNVEADFFTLLNVSLDEGRPFRSDSRSDRENSVILSPEAVAVYGLDNPLGKKVKVMVHDLETNEYAFREKEVIGVLSNRVHFRSLKEADPPFVVQLGPHLDDVLIKLATDDAAATLERIRTRWQALDLWLPFSYSFLDDTYAQLYQQDQRLSRLFVVFAVAALFIAALGLIGLSGYATRQRTKEIGIRKVLGASVTHLLLLLSADAVRLIVIALAVAVPVANYFAQEWLDSYHTRIEVSVWIYALPAVAILLVALLTISQQVISAARRNPVDSLRDE